MKKQSKKKLGSNIQMRTAINKNMIQNCRRMSRALSGVDSVAPDSGKLDLRLRAKGFAHPDVKLESELLVVGAVLELVGFCTTVLMDEDSEAANGDDRCM